MPTSDADDEDGREMGQDEVEALKLTGAVVSPVAPPPRNPFSTAPLRPSLDLIPGGASRSRLPALAGADPSGTSWLCSADRSLLLAAGG